MVQVERADKPQHEAELDELTKELDALKEEKQKVQATIDERMNAGKDTEIGKEREALKKLRDEKGALIDQKKAIRAKMDAIRNQGDKLAKDRKDARQNIRFSNLEAINAEIAKLQKRQETTSMSLSEEKKLIKEMDALQASKKLVADLKSKETDLEDVKEQRKSLSQQIGSKDKEIDAVQREIEISQAKIKEMNEKETDKREQMKSLFTQRDDLRKQMNDIVKKKDASRQVFREKSNAFYNYQRAVRAQKKMQYEEEKKRREEEYEAWRKKKEEEEAKKIPYEEEQALCDYLADYLTRTYLTDAEEAKKLAEEEALKKKMADVIAVKDDPFANFKPVTKKNEEEYFGKGKGKKKRNRAGKKKEKSIAGPFTLSMDTFDQFGLLQLNPPTSIDQVANSVEELKAKKKWYSEQPRGSVPTATDIRKANEKAAAKVKQGHMQNGGATTTTEPPKGGKGKGDKFSLSSDDFVPLGSGGGASSLNAKWGQRSGEEAAEATDVPAEAAAVEAEP